RHLVGEIGHRDRLGHEHVADDRLGRLHRRRLATTATTGVAAAPARARATAARAGAPAAVGAAVATRLETAASAIGLLGPGRRQLLGLDMLLAASAIGVIRGLARRGRAQGSLGGRVRRRGGRLGGRFRLRPARFRHQAVDLGDLGLDGATRALLLLGFLAGLPGGLRGGLGLGPCLGIGAVLAARDPLALGVLGATLGLGGGLGFALALELQALLLGAQLRGLPFEQLALATLFLLAGGELLLVDDRSGRRRRGLGRRGRAVALDEHALLAHLDLDRARLAGGVGLLDLGRLLARQGDLALGSALAAV